MFQAIAHANLASLHELSFLFMEGNRKAAALLALDHFLSRLPVLKSYTIQEVSLFLAKFLEYARLLRAIITHSDPLNDSSIRELFCVREVSSTKYGLGVGSFLHSSATGDRDGTMYLQYSVVSLSKNDVVSVLRKYLAAHLYERVTVENDLCYDASVFSQCLTFIVNGYCSRANCPQEHVKLTDLDPKRYNLRLAIHLQQICILQAMYSVNPQSQRQSTCVTTCPCFIARS